MNLVINAAGYAVRAECQVSLLRDSCILHIASITEVQTSQVGAFAEATMNWHISIAECKGINWRL